MPKRIWTRSAQSRQITFRGETKVVKCWESADGFYLVPSHETDSDIHYVLNSPSKYRVFTISGSKYGPVRATTDAVRKADRVIDGIQEAAASLGSERDRKPSTAMELGQALHNALALTLRVEALEQRATSAEDRVKDLEAEAFPDLDWTVAPEFEDSDGNEYAVHSHQSSVDEVTIEAEDHVIHVTRAMFERLCQEFFK